MENFLSIVLKLTVKAPYSSSPYVLFRTSNFAGQYLWSGGHFNICWSYWGIQK